MKNMAKTKWTQRIILSTLTFAVMLAIVYASCQNNIHTVIKNQVYRSGQISPYTLRIFAHLKKIKTIINLRGSKPRQPWYQKEIAISKQLGIQHYDVAIDANNLPSAQMLTLLTHLLTQAQKPLLIHGKSGTDRSGLASVLALLLLTDTSFARAEEQLSWKYFITSSNSIGKQILRKYQLWLQYHRLNSNKNNFRQWLAMYSRAAMLPQ